MDRRTNPQDGPARSTYPALRDVVGWLLGTMSEQEPNSEALIIAAEEAYERLRVRLMVSLGQLGFDELWARATRLAIRQVAAPNLHRATVPLGTSVPDIRALVGAYAAIQPQDVLLAVFTSFFSVLLSFIGETLMFRIIYQLWPALDERMADSMQQKELDHDEV